MRFVLTIDGPAGAGKSTLARAVAERLGLPFLDTGALYRVVALALSEGGIPAEEGSGLSRALEGIRVRLEGGRAFLGDSDVTEAIRTPEVDRIVSDYAALPSVRSALLGLQRDQADRGLVAEGRDMGTVVFPGADLKIFLWASPEVRAHRRAAELRERGLSVEEPEVLRGVLKRDRIDSTRDTAPLAEPEDAVRIDCSALSAEAVAERVTALARARSGGP